MVWYQNDWGLYGRRYEMIARTWVAERPGDRVLVVEPPLNPWVWFREFRAAWRQRDRFLLGYWAARLGTLFFPFRREAEGLWVYRPFVPWPYRTTGDGAGRSLAYAWAWRRLLSFVKKWRDAVLWACPPHSFVRFAVGRWPGRVCADVIDDDTQVDGLPEELRREFRETYARVLGRAQVAFTVSPAIRDRYASQTKRLVHIPNAVPPEAPGAPASHPPLPVGKRAVYVGRIDDRLDLAALTASAEALPEAQFVFIGAFDPSFRPAWDASLGGLPNVHAWGAVRYDRVPALLKEMDVCLLPHRVTPLTESMDPLKLYVYLAAGKPVVATAARIDPSLAAWVRVAAAPADFARALAEVLDRPQPPSKPDLSTHRWTDRVRRMAALLEEAA